MRGAAVAAGYSVPFAFSARQLLAAVSVRLFSAAHQRVRPARHAGRARCVLPSRGFPGDLAVRVAMGTALPGIVCFGIGGPHGRPFSAAARCRGWSATGALRSLIKSPARGDAAGQDRDETAAKMVRGLSRC
jgi:hypothetical protein